MTYRGNDSKKMISHVLSLSAFVFIVYLAIILSGCTSVSTMSNNNATYSIVKNNTNNEGLIIKQAEISNGNVKLGTYNTFAPQYSAIPQNKIISENYSKEYLKQYMTNVKVEGTRLLNQIDQCNQNVGVYQASCADKETCAVLCGGASDKCALYSKKYGNNIGNLVLSYLRVSKKLKEDVIGVLNTGTNPYIMSDEEISSYVNDLVKLVNDYNIYSTHPFTSDTDFNLCTIPNININKLKPKNLMYNQSEWIKSETIFEKNNTNSQVLSTYDIQTIGKYNKKISIMPIPSSTQSKEGKFSFDWSGLSPYPSYILSLMYTNDNIVPPKISIKKHTTNIILFTPLFYTFDLFSKLIQNKATVAGISLGIYVVLLIILINILFVLYHITKGILNKKPMHEGIWKGASNAVITWKSDTIMLFVLIIISLATWVYSRKIDGDTLFSVFSNILISNSYIAAIHILAVVLSFLFAYFVVQNKFRIYVMEKTYSKKLNLKLQKISDESNKLLYVTLPKIKKAIDELSSQNVDVSEALDRVNSISEKSLFRIINKPNENDKEILSSYEKMLDQEGRHISILNESMKGKYSGWKNKILKIVEERKSIALGEMSFVPQQLRVWVSTKISEEESGIEFENDRLSKIVLTYDNLASKLMKSENVYGVIFYKDKILASEFEDSNESTIMTSLGVKLGYYLKSVESRFGTRLSLLTSLGSNKVVLYASTSNVDVLLLANKNNTKEIWSNITHRLKEMRNGRKINIKK